MNFRNFKTKYGKKCLAAFLCYLVLFFVVFIRVVAFKRSGMDWLTAFIVFSICRVIWNNVAKSKKTVIEKPEESSTSESQNIHISEKQDEQEYYTMDNSNDIMDDIPGDCLNDEPNLTEDRMDDLSVTSQSIVDEEQYKKIASTILSFNDSDACNASHANPENGNETVNNTTEEDVTSTQDSIDVHTSAVCSPDTESNSNQYNKVLKVIMVLMMVSSGLNMLSELISNLIWENYILGITIFLLEAVNMVAFVMIYKHNLVGVFIFFSMMILDIIVNYMLCVSDMETIWISTISRAIIISSILLISKNGKSAWSVLISEYKAKRYSKPRY